MLKVKSSDILTQLNDRLPVENETLKGFQTGGYFNDTLQWHFCVSVLIVIYVLQSTCILDKVYIIWATARSDFVKNFITLMFSS